MAHGFSRRLGEGPLLLCLHGFPDHARSFRHQMEPFAKAGYRVVAPYMRGYAPTGFAPDGNYQSASLSRDIVALIEALGAGPEARKVGEHQLAPQAPPVTVATAPPEPAGGLRSRVSGLTAVGLIPLDGEARNLWL